MSTRKRKTSRTSFGSTRKLPSGRFQARYTDARMVRHTAPHTFATKTQADDWLATVRADVARGTWRAPDLGAVTLADYAAEHLATRLDLAPRTQMLYASVTAGWLNAPLSLPGAPGRPQRTITLGAVPLDGLTVATVREWYAAALHTASTRAVARAESQHRGQRAAAVHHARAWAQSNGHDVKAVGRLPQRVLDAWQAAGSPAAQVAADLERTGAPTKPDAGRAQVAQAYRLLRMLLGHAVREGRIDANPCQIARAGQVKATERVPATPADIEALAQAMPARYAAAVHVAAWSGLRAGELFGLARRHVDLDAGTVRVDRAVSYLPGRTPVIGNTKTESSRRTVHLPPHVVEHLRGHMATYTDPGPDALVFSGPAGQIAPREVRMQTWRRARASVGRPDLRWHDLRHTGATLAAQAGATVRELQHRLGHSTAAAAMIYQHPSHERDRDLAQRLSLMAQPLSDNVRPITGRQEASA